PGAPAGRSAGGPHKKGAPHKADDKKPPPRQERGRESRRQEGAGQKGPRQEGRTREEGGGRDLNRRRRLDTELVRRQLAVSRNQATELIDAGVVLVGGTVAERAGRLVDPAEPVTIAGPPPRHVGPGGEKLDAGLE